MYRINLYPAGAQRRAERTRAVGRAGLTALLAGVQVLFLGLFVLTASNLKQRAQIAENMVASDRNRLAAAGKSNRGVINQIRMAVERRNERVTWAPVLAEIGALLPDNLILDKIEASGNGENVARPGITLTGHVRTGQSMDNVIEFTRRLSASSVYRRQFNEATLGSMATTEDLAKFVITCPLPVRAEPDSAQGETAG